MFPDKLADNNNNNDNEDTDDGQSNKDGAKGEQGDEQQDEDKGSESEESEEREEEEEEEAGKKGGDPDYEDRMVRARHLQLRQAKFLLPQLRHRTNYFIFVYSACRLLIAPLS